MGDRSAGKAPDSTVQTVDEAALEYYQETSVLKPVSARTHTDNWPCFLLTSVTIYHRDGTLANLLQVDLEGPLIVRGRLEIEKDQERFLVNRQMKDRSPYIQLQDTLSFSIGLKEDNPPMPVLWASGGAGWYEIVPSDTYKDICNTMFQGISLHYAILDQYEAALEMLQRAKKHYKQKTLSDVKLDLNTVLIKYAVNVGDGITVAEAKERVKSQATFLLSHFPKDTQFHRQLASEYPDIVRQLATKESNEAKIATNSEPSVLVAIPYRDQEVSNSLEVANGKKTGGREQLASLISGPTYNSNLVTADENAKFNRSREYHNAEKRLDLRTSEEISVAAETDESRASLSRDNSHNTGSSLDTNRSVPTILEVLQERRQELLEIISGERATPELRTLGLSKLRHPDELSQSYWHTYLYKVLSVKKPRTISEVCKYYVRDLLHGLGSEWRKSLFYQWLEAIVDQVPTFDDLPEEKMKNIMRRKKQPSRNGRPSRGNQAFASTQSPLASNPPSSTSSPYVARPPPFNPASRGFIPIMEPQQQPEWAQGHQTADRTRTSGKVAGLRPSIGGKKRLRQDTTIDGDEMELDDDGLQKKVSKKSRYSDDDDDDGDGQGEEQRATVSGNEYSAEEGRAIATGIVDYLTKSTKPTRNGVHEAWACDELGCKFTVQVENEQDAEALIAHHYELHHKDRTRKILSNGTQIQNIVREESFITGGRPVGFLLNRVSRYIATKESQEDIGHSKHQEAQREIRKMQHLQYQTQSLELEDQSTQYQDQEEQLDVDTVPESKQRDTLQ
ncbi:hypothetical protein F5Y11DRAFT_223376 [Daldinia sp. FL1419]|nr:hypothetical protein F5Y11DRAFT_223376 [Daldinia sp. FL1419]